MVWTLRYGDEVRDDADYFGTATSEKPAPALMKLVKRLITERKADWSPEMTKDPVQDRLLEILAAKKKGRKKPAKAKAKAGTADNVVSILDALKRSLATEKPGG